jgi:uncharacterized membrane protein YdbT with pleckstrin-like domain
VKVLDHMTRSQGAELVGEHDAYHPETEAGAVSNRDQTLLPSDILTSGERPLYEARPVLWPLLVRPALLLVVGIAIIIVAQQVPLGFIHSIMQELPLTLIRSIIWWLGIAILAAGLLGALIRYIRWRYTVYAITNQRIMQQTGIIGKSYAACSLSKVQTSYLQITVLGRILNFGTIRMATAGTGSIEMQWSGVKYPRNVHRTLNETLEQYRRDVLPSW